MPSHSVPFCLTLLLIAVISTGCGVADSSAPLAGAQGTAIPTINGTPMSLEEAVRAYTQCGNDWSKSPNQETVDQCARLKEIVVAQQRQQEQQTAEAYLALPRTQTVPGFKPVKLLPEPDWAKTVKEIPLDDLAGGDPTLHGATSVWQAGSVPNADVSEWMPFLVYAKPGEKDGHALLGTLVINGTTDQVQQYIHTWTCPRAVGTITITSVKGPTDTVTFTTSSGQAGKFDLATQTWTFDS